jgi:hypothetical protein
MHDRDLEDLDASLTPIPLEETVCTTAPDFSISVLTVEQAEKAFKAAFDDAQLDKMVASMEVGMKNKLYQNPSLPPSFYEYQPSKMGTGTVTSTSPQPRLPSAPMHEQPWPNATVFTSEQIKTLRMAALDQAVRLGMDGRNFTHSAAMIADNARVFEKFLMGVDSK